jgi:hypothetical protein
MIFRSRSKQEVQKDEVTEKTVKQFNIMPTMSSYQHHDMLGYTTRGVIPTSKLYQQPGSELFLFNYYP